MDLERERGIYQAQSVTLDYKASDGETLSTLYRHPGHVDFSLKFLVRWLPVRGRCIAGGRRRAET